MSNNKIVVFLGDILVIERGGSPRPIKDFITNDKNGINWIKIGDTKNVTKYIYETREKIRPEGLKKSRFVEIDDFILSNSMSYGKPYIMKTTGAIHDGWVVLKNKNGFKCDVDYLYYILSSPIVYNQFSTLAKGSTVKNLNIGLVKKVKIPIFPLPEQRAIVSKIEKLFSELDNGVKNLKTAQEQLKIYRQAVLKKAFEGELTKVWRAKQTNLPTADELLKQIKEERENHYEQQLDDWKQAVVLWEENAKDGKKPNKPKKMKELDPLSLKEIDKLFQLPRSWKYIKINEIMRSLDQGWSPKCDNTPAKEGHWGVIKTTAIQAGKFLEEENKNLPDNLIPREHHELFDGDILITRAGPRIRVGVCCLVINVREKLINCDKAYRIRLQSVNPKYLVSLLNSPVFKVELEKTKSGISDSGVNLKQDIFLKMPIPLCSIEEQNQIVQEIESRLSVCNNIEQTIQDSLEKSEALRQSILKKAFEGKLLTDSELEACRKESDWEPAENLLKRIKAEKNLINQ